MVCISTWLFAFLKFGILKNTRRNSAKISAEMFIVSKPIFEGTNLCKVSSGWNSIRVCIIKGWMSHLVVSEHD